MQPDIPGLEKTEEIGRNHQLVGYRTFRQGRPLVLELLRPECAEVEWFFRSVAIPTQLGHPVFPVHLESGWWKGQPYRLREYVRGRTVQQLLNDGPLPEERLVALIHALASGLAALHQRGYQHQALILDELRVERSGVFRFLSAGQCSKRGAPTPRQGPYYLEPEPLGTQPLGSYDLYCLGRAALDLAVGYPLEEPAAAISNLRLRPSLKALLKALLNSASSRPSAAQVLQHLLQLDEWDAADKLGNPRPLAGAPEDLGRHPFRLIGRQAEMNSLIELARRSTDGKEGIRLVGPAGSGRSRLLEELRRGLSAAEFAKLTWDCVEEGRGGLQLERLSQPQAEQLAEAFLAGPLPSSLRLRLEQQFWWPGELLSALEGWCSVGELSPHWGRWRFGEHTFEPANEPQALTEVVSLEPCTLEALADGLRRLQQSSQSPVDLMQSLLDCLERLVPSSQCSAWLGSHPSEMRWIAGERVLDLPELLVRALENGYSRHEVGPPAQLALPLLEKGGRLGGLHLMRANPFLGVEIEMAERLSALVALDLRRARLFGEQQELLAVTRHRFLTAQIRPHFLFNALNTLAALIAVDSDRAEEMTLDLAEFLRTTFADRPDRVTLAEEVQLVEVYMRLEKARFGERLKWELEVQPGAGQRLLPTLSLQPLIENAVRHGVTSRSQGGTVKLRVETCERGHQVTIEDNGQGFDPSNMRPAGNGVGLANVRERLLGMYGEACEWKLRSGIGQGTTISFRLPYPQS